MIEINDASLSKNEGVSMNFIVFLAAATATALCLTRVVLLVLLLLVLVLGEDDYSKHKTIC